MKNTEKNFSDRLKIVLKNESVLGFSKKAGVGEGNIRQYVKGRLPSIDNAEKIAKAAGVSLEWLVTGNDPQLPAATPDLAKSPFFPIPYYKDVAVSAGHGGVAVNETPQIVSISADWLHDQRLSPNDVFILPVIGDSMEPTICSGDLLLCSNAESHKKQGDGLYVMCVGDSDLMVKRTEILSPTKIRLTSDNKIYEPKDLNRADVAVIGKVVYVIFKRV